MTTRATRLVFASILVLSAIAGEVAAQARRKIAFRDGKIVEDSRSD